MSTRAQQVLATMENEIRSTAPRGIVSIDGRSDVRRFPPADQNEFEPHTPPVESFAPQAQRLPPYVQNHADATQIGMMAAEAVVAEYEASAKAVEAMGEQFKAAGERAALLIAQLAEGQKQVQELAEHYRREGRKVFDQIQDASAMTERTTKAMKAMADEMHGTVAEAVDRA